MSAFIETATFARTPAWHRMGIVTPDAKTSAETIRNAGLDWEVEKRPLFFEHDDIQMSPDGSGMTGSIIHREAYGYYGLVRDSDQRTLGVCQEGYEILQNRDAFGFLDELADKEELRYESAGSLKGGKVVWMLAQLPGAREVIPGDLNVPYLLLASSHDGSLSVRIQPTVIRVVCFNTLSMAINSGRACKYAAKVKHTVSMKARISRAITAIQTARDSFNEYVDTAAKMAQQPVNAERMTAYLHAVLKINDPNNIATRTQNTLQTIIENFMVDAKNRLQGMEESAWGAFNAVTQWADHQRGSRNTAGDTADNASENRFHANQFGQGADLKTNAWNAAQELLMV